MRAELIGHFKACMTDIYLHIDARVADYIRTHPYARDMELSIMCDFILTKVWHTMRVELIVYFKPCILNHA